jgi:hypothetical protein
MKTFIRRIPANGMESRLYSLGVIDVGVSVTHSLGFIVIWTRLSRETTERLCECCHVHEPGHSVFPFICLRSCAGVPSVDPN